MALFPHGGPCAEMRASSSTSRFFPPLQTMGHTGSQCSGLPFFGLRRAAEWCADAQSLLSGKAWRVELLLTRESATTPKNRQSPSPELISVLPSALHFPLDYLVVSPHPDDAELGLAGTLLLLKSQGFHVGILDLTDGEPTPHGSPEIRKRETDAATAILGLDWRGNLGLPNRSLQADIEARHRLAGVIRQLRPRYLFAPFWDDAHPDHVAASALVDAARFWAKLTKTDLPGEPHYPQKIIYYLSVHLRLHAKPSFVVDISPHIETKMQSIACYQSQFI